MQQQASGASTMTTSASATSLTDVARPIKRTASRYNFEVHLHLHSFGMIARSESIAPQPLDWCCGLGLARDRQRESEKRLALCTPYCQPVPGRPIYITYYEAASVEWCAKSSRIAFANSSTLVPLFSSETIVERRKLPRGCTARVS